MFASLAVVTLHLFKLTHTLRYRLAFCTSLLIVSVCPVKAATGTYLPNSTLYPRLIRLAHGPASSSGTIIGSTAGNIFQSTNGGSGWTFLGSVPTASGSTQRCCGTIYEIPQAVGSLSAGTLLYAASYFSNSTPAIEIYKSSDQGHTWIYYSTPVVRGDSSHGLWEPEFTIANDGALVMFWSDETDSCCSQKLAQIRTYDGSTWQSETNTVASTIPSDRPGMAVVTKLPSGIFFMSYELCGPAACTVFYRTSTDGWNFGSSSNVGTKIQTASGQYFEHAPNNTWSPSVLSGNGATLLVGQVLHESNGSVSVNNGKVLFANLSSDGSGNWYTIAAPVQVPTAYDNYCPNYSSALLPATDGSSILEFASDYNANNVCVTYFASEAWNQLPADSTTYTFINQQAGMCLDDYGWGSTNNTIADLWDCTGSVIQRWTVHNQGSGYFSVQNQYTGLCLDNTGGSANAGNLTTLWGCVNNNNQKWRFMDLGNGQYKLQATSFSDLMLDDTGGSTTHGTQLQVWTDNGLAPQHWILQQ